MGLGVVIRFATTALFFISPIPIEEEQSKENDMVWGRKPDIEFKKYPDTACVVGGMVERG